ncbi:hypothetical protein [Tenacibaculum maritimum]|uniref:hypothetical protein n=1 Tax=Tenacibaculum maritimum TaxID=107401 RepID=UPI0012E455E2|nr:hypothetical protein [Tenacibaculum maritimum]CAA0213078.1 conserved hypothetical protein [Tenacibaculum maritimum]
MDNYTEKSLEDLIEVEEAFINSIKEKETLFFSLENNEIYHLSLNIVEKVISIQKLILKENSSLIENYSSLRYILETLIQTELLIDEPNYTYKLFYSIYNHQIDKTNKFIERIKKEILIMEKYELEDRKTTDILKNGIDNNIDNELSSKIYQKAIKELDDKADLEYTMFCGNFKWFGYGYTKSHLEEKVLPEYQKRLELFENGKTEIAKKLIKKASVSKHFNFSNQHTKVFKELKDNRSWKEKASITKLDDEYNLVYDLSSALLHSTSYSFKTKNNIEDYEMKMIKNLCFKYSKKMMINLNSYTNMEFYDRFKMIVLGENK